MTPTRAVINDYCRQQQQKALESQAKASKITTEQAEAQALFILSHGDKTKRASRHNNESIRAFGPVSEDPFKDRFEIHLRNR